MPAPKTPNTSAATRKRRRIGQETMANKLRAAGWTLTAPVQENEQQELIDAVTNAQQTLAVWADRLSETEGGDAADLARKLNSAAAVVSRVRGYAVETYQKKAPPKCPRCGGLLEWVMDSYACVDCDDEWTYETIHGVELGEA